MRSVYEREEVKSQSSEPGKLSRDRVRQANHFEVSAIGFLPYDIRFQ